VRELVRGLSTPAEARRSKAGTAACRTIVTYTASYLSVASMQSGGTRQDDQAGLRTERT
jgi:hypothetical protein